jgi:hypothetical protein
VLKYHLARRLAALVAAGLAVSPALATASDATWEQWLPLPGAADVDGPRSDGTFIVAGSAALYLLDPAGTLQPFARGPGGYREDPHTEAYIAVSSGGHVEAAGCDFNPDDTFILRMHGPLGVNRVNATGDESGSFTNITGVSSLTGITFDRNGAFDHRLLVMGLNAGKTTVFAVDCNGGVQVIKRSLPLLEGQMAVAPPGFGAFAGQLIIPDESGRVLALAATGALTVLIKKPLPGNINPTLGGVGFVPDGFTERGGAAYHVDRLEPKSSFRGRDFLIRVTSDQLVNAGVQNGDLLAVAEDGGAMLSIRCTATCTATMIIAGDKTAHVEGHVAFFVNPPGPPPASPAAAKVGRALVPQGLTDFAGMWGIPTTVFLLLVAFLAVVAVQAIRRRAR